MAIVKKGELQNRASQFDVFNGLPGRDADCRRGRLVPRFRLPSRSTASADQTKNAAVGVMPLRRIKCLLVYLYFIPDCPENLILLRSQNGFPRNVL